MEQAENPYAATLGVLERAAFNYLQQRIFNGRQYVSLAKMAKQLSLREDQCETFITKFHADRAIPRMQIVEEVEG